MSVRDSARASLALAYKLTKSPGTSLKSSSESVVEPSACFAPFCFRTACLLRPSVYGTVKGQSVEAELVLGLNRDSDFFDWGWRGIRRPDG